MVSTLRELSLKAIIPKIYDDTPPDLEGLKNLPITLKNNLLKMATEPFTRSISSEDCSKKYLCSFLASLMHSEITTLRLPMLAINPVSEGEYLQLLVLAQHDDLYNCAPREVTETLSILDRQERAEDVPMLIDAIDAKCFRLKTLQIMKFSDPKMEIIKDSLFDSPAFFRVLSRLTSLDLDCYDCHDWALEQIGTHATNLVVLQVGLMSYVSSNGFKALSKLQHLEQFIFGRDSEYSCGWTEESKHIVLCTKYLPQLKVIGRRLEFIGFDNSILIPEGYHNDMLQHLQQPAILGLQLLNLAGLAGDCLPNENIHFPQLEVLILWAPTNNMLNLCDRFESVSALAIYHGCLFEDIMPVLCRVGQRLHSLVLFKVDKKISLAEVLLNCPRLKCLALEESKFTQAPERWPAASFLCMEEVRLISMKLPPGFMKQILQSATKLRKLEYMNCELSNHEMRELVQLMRQRPILPNIVYIWWIEDDVDSIPNMDTKHLKLLLQTFRDTFPDLNLEADE